MTEDQRNGCLGCLGVITLPVIVIAALTAWAVWSDSRTGYVPKGIPDATATAAQVITDSGYYYGKDVAVSGEVAFVRGGTITLGPLVDGRGVDCYMRSAPEVRPGQQVIIRGNCFAGDRGTVLDNAVITK
jgi:hypothetical protein